MKKLNFFISFILIIFSSCDVEVKKNKSVKIVTSDRLKNYVDLFNKKDNEIYKQFIPNNEAFIFLIKNIPMITISNPPKAMYSNTFSPSLIFEV